MRFSGSIGFTEIVNHDLKSREKVSTSTREIVLILGRIEHSIGRRHFPATVS